MRPQLTTSPNRRTRRTTRRAPSVVPPRRSGANQTPSRKAPRQRRQRRRSRVAIGARTIATLGCRTASQGRRLADPTPMTWVLGAPGRLGTLGRLGALGRLGTLGCRGRGAGAGAARGRGGGGGGGGRRPARGGPRLGALGRLAPLLKTPARPDQAGYP